jgi:hypothetical protein
MHIQFISKGSMYLYFAQKIMDIQSKLNDVMYLSGEAMNNPTSAQSNTILSHN